jgi:hypothetical protein
VEQGFSILMFFFAGALLLYAALMAITKDYNILPFRASVSVKPKNPKKYTVQMAKIIALVALAIAFGAAIALWNGMAGALVMIVCVTAAIWAGTKIIKKAQM